MMVRDEQPDLCDELDKLKLEIIEQGQLSEMIIKYDLEDRIREAQKQCPEILEIQELMKEGKAVDYRVDEQGTLWLKDRICVPKDEQIRGEILKEGHDSKYSIHLGSMKMYQDLKDRFWWKDMRTEIAEYVAKCDTAEESRLSTNVRLDCSSLWTFQYGSGTTSAWISSWDYLVPRTGMMRYG